MSHKDSEKWLERTHAKRYKDLGGKSIKMECNFERGLPDRLCIAPNGQHFYIEFKSKGKKPSPIQLVKHRELRALNCDVYVCDNELDMLSLLRIGIPVAAFSDRTVLRYDVERKNFVVLNPDGSIIRDVNIF